MFLQQIIKDKRVRRRVGGRQEEEFITEERLQWRRQQIIMCKEELRELREWCQVNDVPVVSLQEYRDMLARCTNKTKLEGSGKGYHGRSCTLLQDGGEMDLVVKSFRVGAQALEDLKHEASFLRQTQVRGVQRLVGVCAEKLALVCHNAGTPLSEFVARDDTLTAEMALSVLGQVINACAKLRKRKVAHNDIREETVCVKRRRVNQDRVLVRLIGFGLARHYGQKVFFPDAAVWNAPEIFTTGECCEATEVYSIGMLAGRLAYHCGGHDVFNRVFGSSLRKATSTEPSSRPSIQTLLDRLDHHGVDKLGKDTDGFFGGGFEPVPPPKVDSQRRIVKARRRPSVQVVDNGINKKDQVDNGIDQLCGSIDRLGFGPPPPKVDPQRKILKAKRSML